MLQNNEVLQLRRNMAVNVIIHWTTCCANNWASCWNLPSEPNRCAHNKVMVCQPATTVCLLTSWQYLVSQKDRHVSCRTREEVQFGCQGVCYIHWKPSLCHVCSCVPALAKSSVCVLLALACTNATQTRRYVFESQNAPWGIQTRISMCQAFIWTL